MAQARSSKGSAGTMAGGVLSTSSRRVAAVETGIRFLALGASQGVRQLAEKDVGSKEVMDGLAGVIAEPDGLV